MSKKIWLLLSLPMPILFFFSMVNSIFAEVDKSIALQDKPQHNLNSQKNKFNEATNNSGKNSAMGPDDQSTYRGMWVWNTNIVSDTTAQNEFLIFTSLKNIKAVFLYAFDIVSSNPIAVSNFIKTADENGSEVELLAGDPSWALTPTHSIALSFVQQAIDFTQNSSEGSKPYGIHLDIEPYLLPEWDSDRSSTINQYLDLLTKIQEEIATSEAPLILTIDMPFWFDTISATYGGNTKPLNQHIQDISDRVVILDYRDFAEGPDGIIHHAQDEIDYANNIAKEVTIGVETNKSELDKITFYEEGEEVMEMELAKVVQHFQADPAFFGIAIHDYLGYSDLAPIKKTFAPLIVQ